MKEIKTLEEWNKANKKAKPKFKNSIEWGTSLPMKKIHFVKCPDCGGSGKGKL